MLKKATTQDSIEETIQSHRWLSGCRDFGIDMNNPTSFLGSPVCRWWMMGFPASIIM